MRASSPRTGCSMPLGELAELLGGDLAGDAARVVEGVARLDEAGSLDVSFCALSEYRSRVATTEAAAVIVPEDFEPPDGQRDSLTLIRVDNPYLAVADAVAALYPEEPPAEGIHPTAVIGSAVDMGEGVAVGARAVIGDRVTIGMGTTIDAGCVLAAGVSVGRDCRLYPNVTLYPDVTLGDRVVVHAGAVLGADGFGYAHEGTRRIKIRQVGGVVIEDDVEIGANACVDRAALGTTRIGRGTKIDNLVQIGHNCDVGADSILCGQVGVGGSTKIGKGVMIGGQAGLAGHFSVGDGAMIAAQTGVINDVPAGVRVAGYPHLEVSRWRRAIAALRNLPELVKRVRRLEAAVEDSRKGEE